MNIIFALGIFLLVGYLSGRVASRFKIPEVTGYIVAGILIGPSVLHLIPESITEHELDFVVDLALGLIAFSIGGGLNLKQVGKLGKSIISITLFQCFGAFLLVTLTIFLFSNVLRGDRPGLLSLSLLLGAIASATAPAATIAVINELRAKGLFTTTLLSVVALDDALAIGIFGVAHAFAISLLGKGGSTLQMVTLPIREIFGSLILGGAAGFILHLIFPFFKTRREILMVVLGSVLFIGGCAIALHFSSLLTNITAGFVVVNLARRNQRFVASLDDFTPPVYAVFFVLAGTHLKFAMLAKVGLLGLIFILARSIGKIGGTFVGGHISKAPDIVKKWLGVSLLPQAGVAVGLALIAYENPILAPYSDILINVVLASVAINEIIGPPATAFAIRKSKEVNRKLIDTE